MTSISFDRAANYYDSTRGYPPGVDAQIATAIIAATGATPATRFLEIGIGTGRIALPLIVRGYDYSGIDLSTEMIAQLRAKLDAYTAEHPDHAPLHVDLRIGDSTTMPFADAQFAVVITVHVLHLISQWQLVLQETMRVLQPGGWYLNCYDANTYLDVPTDATNVQKIWVDILAELGGPPVQDQHIGANAKMAAEELVRMGLHPEVLYTVSWQAAKIPSQEVDYLAQRMWSRTWDVPDELFAESIRRLRVRAQQRFGTRYDQPFPFTGQFVITRVQKPV